MWYVALATILGKQVLSASLWGKWALLQGRELVINMKVVQMNSQKTTVKVRQDARKGQEPKIFVTAS